MKRFSILLLLLLLCITSCNARGSYETDSFDTTAPEVTTDEVTTSGETTDEVTTSGETEYVEPEGILLSEILGKWYFDWTPSPFEIERVERNFQNKNYSEADRQYALKTPILYKTETGGIKVDFCFFKEYYKLGEVIQVRITIQNKTEKPYTFQDSPMYGTGLETLSGSSCGLYTSTAWLSPEDRMSFVMEPLADFMLPITLSPGESVHIERVFPELSLNKAKLKYFWYRLNGWIIRIPVSVVQLSEES